MRSIILGIVVIVGSFTAGASGLFPWGTIVRGTVAPARPVVALYHQESSMRAVHTSHGYRVIASSGRR